MTEFRSFSTLAFRGHGNEIRNGFNTVLFGAAPANRDFSGFEEVTSNGHIWPPRKGDRNSGGAFSLRRIQQEVSPCFATGRAWVGVPGPNTQNYYFKGMLIPQAAVNGVYTGANLRASQSNSTMKGKGTQGWARFKPTASRGGLDQAIGEIHQVPSLFNIRRLKAAFEGALRRHGGRKYLSRVSGQEYLNYQFGWVPIISDLLDVVENAYNLEKRMRQLLKDNGKPVRRRGTISSDGGVTQATSSHNAGGASYPALASPLYDGGEDASRTVTTSLKYWFSAKFRYHIVDPRKYQDGYLLSLQVKPREAYQLQRILFGAEVTPETLYNITPWSWLIDWVVPVGDIINNAVNDSVDGLVADYSYVMCHNSTKTHDTVSGKLVNGPPYSCSSLLTSETKQRVAASPYGFGITLSSLSSKQLAILAALGFSKLS
ncbi:maturation protein [ssRNA phage SRR6960799_35]|uniref:Maturation protein n=1 Tax=ssRNA phage SRR6960799_35 TaxID=2786593 RepID=A0A8S5L0K0_9VIRU|nr:maturation protein [ssRNA phage SRR6960799_35]DAD50658.1 TPA_asm: maturation protein [ssRNA phage SRR6960799_35]